MSIAAAAQALLTEPEAEPTFCERNIAPLSFAVSTVAIMSLRPTLFLAGVVGGIGLHHYRWVQVQKDPGGRVIPIINSIFAIIGAVATAVSYTAGGIFIHTVSFLSSVTIGMTFYRAMKL